MLEVGKRRGGFEDLVVVKGGVVLEDYVVG